MTGMVVLVVGPSGVGKDTLLDGARGALEEDARFHFLKRDITRPASAGGEVHTPVSIEQFEQRLADQAYALNWGAHNLRYGLPKSELSGLANGLTVIANGSRSVLDEARRVFDRLAIISVTASEDLLRERLIARNRETVEDIEARIARATAFELAGEDVFEVRNDGSVEDGISAFVHLLTELSSGAFVD